MYIEELVLQTALDVCAAPICLGWGAQQCAMIAEQACASEAADLLAQRAQLDTHMPGMP